MNFKNHLQTSDFVKNLVGLPGSEDISVIVASNDPDGSGIQQLKVLEVDKRVKVLSWKENLGYFGAANRAYESLNEDFSLLIIANSDLKITDSEFIKKLSKLPRSINAGAIGPSIISELSNKETNPYMLKRPAKYKMHIIKWIFRYWALCQLYQWLGLAKSILQRKLKLKRGNNALSEAISCYAIHGAFMILTSEYFKRGGDLKHPVFLYNEEIYVAENCQKNGLRVIFDPSLKVVHQEHGSIGLLYSRSILKFKSEAAKYFADRYF